MDKTKLKTLMTMIKFTASVLSKLSRVHEFMESITGGERMGQQIHHTKTKNKTK